MVRRVGWHRNVRGMISARGMLFNAEGQSVTGTMRPGPGPGEHSADLKEPWASDYRMTTRFHVEGHAAALMREHRLSHGVLYLNIPPCGRADDDIWKCDPNIEKVLPAGTKLTVWVVKANGGFQQIRYEGTGEALR